MADGDDGYDIEAAMMKRALDVETQRVARPSAWLMTHSFLLKRCDGDFSKEPASIDLLDFMVALRMEARASFTELHLARFLTDGRKPVRFYAISKRAALAVHGELAHLDAHRSFEGLFQRRIPRAAAELPVHRNIMIWLLLRKRAYQLNLLIDPTSFFEPIDETGHALAFFEPAGAIAVRMPSGRHLIVTAAEAADLLERRSLSADVADKLRHQLRTAESHRSSTAWRSRHPLARTG
ncbi:hypothetical protein [Chthonobacter albigriseus]|uniref:hypothetical protein n=1 Tax=Chthonobacter albigriseus TaxID=1683161 RepID=UPI0015EE95E8|nr:hypothetical protein [Chthonobacter albigriseus]